MELYCTKENTYKSNRSFLQEKSKTKEFKYQLICNLESKNDDGIQLHLFYLFQSLFDIKSNDEERKTMLIEHLSQKFESLTIINEWNAKKCTKHIEWTTDFLPWTIPLKNVDIVLKAIYPLYDIKTKKLKDNIISHERINEFCEQKLPIIIQQEQFGSISLYEF
jgi:hypothetical protein